MKAAVPILVVAGAAGAWLGFDGDDYRVIRKGDLRAIVTNGGK
jgi:hypothetical protein